MKSISVPIELLEDMLNPCADFATHERLRALLDNLVVESQYDGMTQDQAQAVSDGVDEILHDKPAAQHHGKPVAKLHAERLTGKDGEYGVTVEDSEWFNSCRQTGGIFNLYAEPPAPVADHTQCEECKGWGYHENHYEGGGTECGECGGSGNATVAVAQSEFEPDAICLESDGCPTEGAVLKRFWRENQPDPVLCEFYEAEDFPSLVRELVGHVAQLQEAAKRNVKPWEDTFPPTLLPAYIARINAEQPAPVAVVMAGQLNTFCDPGCPYRGEQKCCRELVEARNRVKP